MVVHIIVDYSFLYYKYKFQLDSGKMRHLTSAVDWHGVVIEKDISQIYYSIKEIEGFRRKFEQLGHNVYMSICFDMPSSRKEATEETSEEAASKYKSNRVKRLNDDDFENIQFVEKLLSDAGYNTYRRADYEADDLVSYLVSEYSEAFDYTLIYTPDADLLVNIGPKVGVCRFKALKGYSNVDDSNYSRYLSEEMKCYIPYNALMLFKATVGDKSDCIDGIKKFGPKAFDKLINYLMDKGIDWEKLNDFREVDKVLDMCHGYLSEDQLSQAKESLSLVRPKVISPGIEVEFIAPTKKSTRELRETSYMRCGMKTLVD